MFLFPQAGHLATITSQDIVEMTNQKRKEHEISSLRANHHLKQAARLKAKTILSEQTFGHEVNEHPFSYWINLTPYQYKYAGENLAIDFHHSSDIIQAWMESDSHRNNLLDPRYKDIGVGVVQGEFQGQESIIVVQLFGSPRPSSATTTKQREKEEAERERDRLNLLIVDLEFEIKTELAKRNYKTRILNGRRRTVQ